MAQYGGLHVIATAIKATTLSFETFHEHGPLFSNLLKARKRAFVDELGWDLPNVDGMEFDQYDTPMSRWIAVHRGAEVLAGVRLTPTTSRVMTYTYMLKDAQDGRLEGFPTDVLHEEAPVTAKVWEASRVFILDGLPLEQRSYVRNVLLAEMLRAGYSLGAKKLICLLPTWWPRLSRHGMAVRAIGPLLRMGSVSQAVEIDILKSSMAMGEARYDIRAAAHDGRTPADILADVAKSVPRPEKVDH
jgi:acyl homoserine lactone synthase